jgi:hypothetical protein
VGLVSLSFGTVSEVADCVSAKMPDINTHPMNKEKSILFFITCTPDDDAQKGMLKFGAFIYR